MYNVVTETIARYGDASCAMCYVMHIGAVEALKLRATPYLIDKYLKQGQGRPDRHALATPTRRRARTSGTRSPPAPASVDGGFEVLKKASWTTSAGFADFYVCQTTSPDFNGDYSNLSVFVIDKDQIQAEPQKWDAMGLRGNQSGSLLCDWGFVPDDQLSARSATVRSRTTRRSTRTS